MSIMFDDVLHVCPTLVVAAAINGDDQNILPLGDISHKTGPRLDRVSCLAKNMLFPVEEQRAVM